MNITGLSTTSLLTSSSVAGAAAQPAQSTSSYPPPSGAAGSASISKPGALFSELQQLSQQDPTKFAQVTASMAKALRADAQKEGGAAAKRLDALADKLDQASQSGDVSQLVPPPPAQAAGSPQGAAAYQQSAQQGGHHHHHHGGGGGSGGGAASQVASDLAQAFTSAMSASSAA